MHESFIGRYVRLSDEGKRMFFRKKSIERRKFGEIIGISRKNPQIIRIKWDGVKYPEYLHEDFIDMVRESEYQFRSDEIG